VWASDKMVAQSGLVGLVRWVPGMLEVLVEADDPTVGQTEAVAVNTEGVPMNEFHRTRAFGFLLSIVTGEAQTIDLRGQRLLNLPVTCTTEMRAYRHRLLAL
jgi:hypothetical protein